MTGAKRQRAPRITRDCTHVRVRHEHGTTTAYKLDWCRCAPCTEAIAVAERRRQLAIAMGAPPLRVDAGEVRDHIRALQAQGVGYKRVAQLAGVAVTTVAKIIGRDPSRPDGGPQRRVAAETARRILAVQANLDTVSDGGLIDATGTLRRLHALHARGWSRRALAARLGVEPNTLRYLEGSGTCTGRIARAVRALYEELWDVEPPTATGHDRAARTRTIRWATGQGWPPPAAFDDAELDDPSPSVDKRAHSRVHGRISATERLDELVFLLDGGTAPVDAARRAGYASLDSARSVAARTGHPAAARLAPSALAVAA